MPIKTAEQVLRDAKAQIQEYTPAEVMEKQKRGEKLTLLDVRDPNEASLGKIPGAVHISRGRLEQNIEAAVRGRPGRMIPPEGNERYAAVAAVFRAGADDQPELLMIKRAEHEGDPWSGHVALPGGRMDPRDRDLEQTAVRETWEETGIDIERDGYVLGRLDDLAPRMPVLPPLVIRPFVAVVPPTVTIVANPEVADA